MEYLFHGNLFGAVVPRRSRSELFVAEQVQQSNIASLFVLAAPPVLPLPLPLTISMPLRVGMSVVGISSIRSERQFGSEPRKANPSNHETPESFGVVLGEMLRRVARKVKRNCYAVEERHLSPVT